MRRHAEYDFFSRIRTSLWPLYYGLRDQNSRMYCRNELSNSHRIKYIDCNDCSNLAHLEIHRLNRQLRMDGSRSTTH